MASQRFAARTEARAEIGRLRRSATTIRKQIAKMEADPNADQSYLALCRETLAATESRLRELGAL